MKKTSFSVLLPFKTFLILLCSFSILVCQGCKSKDISNPILMNPEEITVWEYDPIDRPLNHNKYIHQDWYFIDVFTQGQRVAFTAYDIQNGQILWQAPEEFFKVPVDFAPFFGQKYSSVVFSENLMILPNQKQELVAFDLASFTPKWRLPSQDQAITLLGTNDTYLFLSSEDNTLHAVDLKTGSIMHKEVFQKHVDFVLDLDFNQIALVSEDKRHLWIWDTESWESIFHFSQSTDKVVTSTLMSNQRRLYFMTYTFGTSIYALDLNLQKIIWKQSFSEECYYKFSELKLFLYQDILLVPFWKLNNEPNIKLLSISDGKQIHHPKWKELFFSTKIHEKKSNEGEYMIICGIHESKLILTSPFADTPRLLCYDLKTNELKWKLSFLELVDGPIVINEKYLFVSDRTGSRSSDPHQGYYLIEILSGKILWQTRTERGSFNQFYQYFESPHWNTLVFPYDSNKIWDLAPIIQAWEARKP